MDYHSILYEKEGGIGRIVLNRPRAFNALDRGMIEELLDSLRNASEDPQVRVLILTGSGRAFCFGADIEEFRKAREQGDQAGIETLLQKAQEIILLLAGLPKPTLAVLNGFAAGLGLDLALACDMRIASARVKVSEAFVSMGLVPDGGGTFFLPRLVGLAKAAELIFTGEPIPALEAERIGLINRVVPSQELEKVVKDLADKISRGPSLALGFAKQALRKNLQGSLSSALRVEADLQRRCLQSEDHREADIAFLEKREPVFKGT